MMDNSNMLLSSSSSSSTSTSTTPSATPRKKDLATLAGLVRPSLAHSSYSSYMTAEEGSSPQAIRTLHSSTAAGSTSHHINSYARPSIESTAAAHMKYQHGQYTATSNDELFQEDDATAISHHDGHSGDQPIYYNDEDATIRIPAAATIPPPNTYKELPAKPPRPPRMRPPSTAISVSSVESASEGVHSEGRVVLQQEEHLNGSGNNPQYLQSLRYGSRKHAPSPSVETMIPISSSSARRSSISRSNSLARTSSSKSQSRLPHQATDQSSSSSSSYHDSSIAVTDYTNLSSPFIDVSSTCSSTSSSFPHTPGVSEDQDARHGNNVSSNAHLAPQHMASGGNGLLRRNKSLIRNNKSSDEGHGRSSVYTTHTSASDWARERETEMRNSRSGVFDLEYELQDESSGSSLSVGYHHRENGMVASTSQLSFDDDELDRRGTHQASKLQAERRFTPPPSRDGNASIHSMASSSTSALPSGFRATATSRSSSPSSPLRIQPRSSSIPKNLAHLALPNPPSPSSPTSPTSAAGFGLGITSDDAIHPVGGGFSSSSSSPPSGYPSPDLVSSFNQSNSLGSPQPPLSASTVGSITSIGANAAAVAAAGNLPSQAPQSRWSTTKSYMRRNTASSISRSLHKSQSKASLLDTNTSANTNTNSPSLASLQHSSSCTSLSDQLGPYPQYGAGGGGDDTTSTTGYNSESDRPNTGSHLSHFAAPTQKSTSQGMFNGMLSNADFNINSTRRSPASQFGSVYTSNANSYLSNESLAGGDDFEEMLARSRPQKASMDALSQAYQQQDEQQQNQQQQSSLPVRRTLLHPNGGSTRPTSQAVAMVENGEGKVVKIHPEQNLDEINIPPNTTHLIFSGVMQPVALNNLLSSILPSLSQHLLVLDISHCSLSSLPQTIALCSNLEELNMSGNIQASATLPSFINSLSSLRVLLADSCGINSILHSFSNLRHSHTVALRNNNLRFLPSWISRLSESLELLLLDDNPFYGDYADLVRSCAQSYLVQQPKQSVEMIPGAVESKGSDSPGVDQSFTSQASVAPVDQDENEVETSFPSPSFTRPFATKSPRASLISRTSSVRLAFSRSFGGLEETVSQSASPVHSLLLADTASQASTARRRASILKPMKSMGDLSSSQPSIHELVALPAPLHAELTRPFPLSPAFSEALTMSSEFSSASAKASPSLRPSTSRKSLGASFAARRSRKSSKGMTALEFIAAEVGEARNSQLPSDFPKAVSSSETSMPMSPETADEKPKEGRPGFFKKLSMAARRRKSNSMVPGDLPIECIPPMPLVPSEQAELGIGRPSFLNGGSLRSQSAPDTVNTRRGQSKKPEDTLPLPSRPPTIAKSPSTIWQSSLQSSFLEGSRRSRKKSRPPIPEPLLNADKVPEKTDKPSRRRSYLMLNSVLPPVVSPGPLAMSFDHAVAEDQTIHAKPTLASLEEERPSTDERPTPEADKIAFEPMMINQWSTERRKSALAPLMAYLRDLDDLARQPEHKAPLPPKQDVPSPVLRSESSRQMQRNASSAAVSMVSSLQPDRSSGYESSRADSTGMTSPSSIQGPPSKVKDDPIKRERIIAEILSSERSYLASLQDLVTLYIAPASAPLRGPGDSNRETWVPQAERNLVFSVVESITQFHTSVFLPELEKAAVFVGEERNSASSLDHALLRQTAIDIAKVFIDHAAFLKLYHSYTVNFDTTLDRLALWNSFKSSSNASATPPLPSAQKAAVNLTSNQKKRIRHLLKTAKKDPRHKQIDLQSYLLMPIQRVPRYKLLLEVLLECTPLPGSLDQGEPVIAVALETMSNLASEMNERKRDNEGRKRLLHWQAQLTRFKSPLVQPHRSVLREGHMQLERVVKRDNAVIASSPSRGQQGSDSDTSALQIPVLRVDRTTRKLIYVLCNDILILILDSEGSAPAEKYETFTVLRLGKSLGGRDQPASIFGRPDRLRIVEDRAILYLFCPDAESAQTCRDLINRQSLQTGISYRFSG